jgi:hypothetical protein
LTGSVFAARAGAAFVATGLVGSLTVPLVFEFVLGVFVLLAIIKNKQFGAPVRSNEAIRTGALSNGYAAGKADDNFGKFPQK